MLQHSCIMSFIMLLALERLYDVFIFNYALLHNYDMFQVYVKSNPLQKSYILELNKMNLMHVHLFINKPK